MAAFGKILVILNLVFAMITGGLIGMVYLTRTNWKAAYDKVQAGAVAADASYKQLLSERDAANDAIAKQRNEAVNQLTEETKKVEAAKKEIEDLNNKLLATTRNNDKDSENVKRVTAEIEKSRLEVTQMREQLTDRDRRITDLERQLTRTRDEAVNNQLNYNSLKERYQNLLAQNEELSKQVARAGAGGARPTDKAPPPEQVRGTVKVVDGNLATISLGSDAGVNKDHVLFLFRLSPEPRYLGKLTILSTTPFEAVGRIETNTRSTQIKPGDEVASRIAGLK
jgi:hypothetical protein